MLNRVQFLARMQNLCQPFCLDHLQEDQSTKGRLSAVRNMLQRAITVDKVSYTTDSSCQKRESQLKLTPCSECERPVETYSENYKSK